MRGMCIYCIYICILDVDFIYMFFFLRNYGLMDIHNYVLWI